MDHSQSAGITMDSKPFHERERVELFEELQQNINVFADSPFDFPHTIFKKFFDACQEVRFISNREGRLIAVNHTAAEVFGYESGEEILKLESTAPLFWEPEDLETIREIVGKQHYLKGLELPMRRRDGTKFMALIAINSRVKENGVVFYHGQLQDVTEQSNWQRAFIESEKRVVELLEAEQRNKLLNADILRMLMIMSHDIRSPLVAMAATLKLLIRGSYGPMDKSVENTVKDLLCRAIQLIGIAEDCLGKAYSIDGSIEVSREVLDLRQDVIDPVLDELSGDIQKQQIMIDNRLGAIPAGTLPVSVNKTWLKAVFRNLFKNAIK